MAQSIQALRERRAAIGAQLKDLNDKSKNPTWDGTLQAKYDAGIKEVDDIDAEIQRIEDYNKRIVEDLAQNNADNHAARNPQNAGAQIYAKWLRGGDKAISDAEWQQYSAEMTTQTGADGGYTVPTETATSVIDALKAFGGMRQVATVISTATGSPMNWPTSDGTQEEGELLAESEEANDADVKFGTIPLGVFKFSSKVVTVPIELLQDSGVNLEAFINKRLQTRLGRITNKKFTNGTGNNEPKGLMASVGVGVTGAAVNPTFNDLVDLIHSVDPAYRDNGKFMFADMTLRDLKKLTDDQKRPIWLPGYALKEPDTINGYGYSINQDVVTAASGKTPIVFGDLSYYVIRDALALQMYRFSDSAYAKKGQVGFLMFLRSGGTWTDVGGAAKTFKSK